MPQRPIEVFDGERSKPARLPTAESVYTPATAFDATLAPMAVSDSLTRSLPRFTIAQTMAPLSQ